MITISILGLVNVVCVGLSLGVCIWMLYGGLWLAAGINVLAIVINVIGVLGQIK